MIRNEIGCCNRWGRYAFRWRTYRSMHHWIKDFKENDCWEGYDELKKFDQYIKEKFR